jgi:hypothetical protein
MTNLAINDLGACYALDVLNNNLGSIDLNTGVFTAIGPVGFDAQFAQDMEFDRESGDLYMAAQDANSGWLAWVNTSTGANFKIGDFEGGAEITGLAIPYTLVTFNIDMSTASGFVPGTDVVYLTGNLNSWITPGDPGSIAMTRVGSTLIYTHTLTLSSGTYEYKYFKNAGWDGGEYTGGLNRSVTVTNDATVSDTWGGSINWANLQWPATGNINLGDTYDVFAQVYIPNGITAAEGSTYGLQTWIGYSTTNTNPNTWTQWVPATFNLQSGNNDEYKANLGSIITTTGIYYYASRMQFGTGNYVYGGYSGTNGGFWDGTTNVSGVLTVNIPATKTLNLTLFLEGLCRPLPFNGTMQEAQGAGNVPQFGAGIADQVSIELHDGLAPYALAYGPYSVNLNISGALAINTIPGGITGSYYIVVKNHNHLETWSAAPVDFGVVSPVTFNFSSSLSQAYNNKPGNDALKLMGSVYAIWGGEALLDGIVDASDMSAVFNASKPPALAGYNNQDVNEDGIVDASDMSLIFNNSKPPTRQVQKP